jgi:hypothetical protein
MSLGSLRNELLALVDRVKAETDAKGNGTQRAAEELGQALAGLKNEKKTRKKKGGRKGSGGTVVVASIIGRWAWTEEGQSSTW